MPETEIFDVLVVGGGMAGCILATRIAEKGVNPKTGKPLKIALLERGPYFKADTRIGYGSPLRRRLFTNITEEFREGNRYAAEKVRRGIGAETAAIGGASLHWDAHTQVPFDLDYGAWKEESGVDWTADKLRPAAQEIQRLFNIHSRPESLLTRADFLFRDASLALGYSVTPMTLAKQNCIGCGYCNSIDFCKYDAKMGPLLTHIPQAERLGVLRIIPDAEVEKVILEKQGARVIATGIQYRNKGETLGARAGKIIVACGVHFTPILLARSGYGSREVLGNNLIAENANIGRHLDARPSCESIRAVFNEPINDGEYHDGSYDLFHDVHPQGYFDRLLMNFRAQQLPSVPDTLASGRLAPEFGREHKAFMRRVYALQTANSARDAILKSGSFGVSVVRPAGILGRFDGQWRLQYDDKHPGVLRRLKEGLDIAYAILEKMGPRQIDGPKGPVRVSSVSGDTGSCRAGSDRTNSVVNSDFETHDVENLFICDGSTPPRIASRGFGSPIATLATYAAQRMVARFFSA